MPKLISLKTLTTSASFALALSACGPVDDRFTQNSNDTNLQTLQTNDTPAIVNGAPVTLENPIAAVAVKIETNTGACSGTMIAPRFALTAAHCVARASSAKVTTVGGKFSTSQAKFYVNPEFKSDVIDNRNDVALIEFDNDFKLTEFAILADEKTNPRDGESAFIAGYGVDSADGTYADFGVLRSLAVTVTNLKYSNAEVEISEGSASGACHGDSGGPAYSLVDGHVVLWGTDVINSRNSDKDCMDFELYTRVSTFAPWILTVIDSSAPPSIHLDLPFLSNIGTTPTADKY